MQYMKKANCPALVLVTKSLSTALDFVLVLIYIYIKNKNEKRICTHTIYYTVL